MNADEINQQQKQQQLDKKNLYSKFNRFILFCQNRNLRI